jgi:hypothetical protein
VLGQVRPGDPHGKQVGPYRYCELGFFAVTQIRSVPLQISFQPASYAFRGYIIVSFNSDYLYLSTRLVSTRINDALPNRP